MFKLIDDPIDYLNVLDVWNLWNIFEVYRNVLYIVGWHIGYFNDFQNKFYTHHTQNDFKVTIII
jgi:hypothetical protein